MVMQSRRFVEFHIKTPKYNGVPEALQGLLEAR